jgi:hypothetical protein
MAMTRITGSLDSLRAFFFLLFLSLAPFVESTIGEDGLCNLFTYVPFTIGYVPYAWSALNNIDFFSSNADSFRLIHR